MREVVLDTETTGLNPSNGDRVVEIGCVELVNHVPSGRTFHTYLDPECDMPSLAFDIHGLSSDFLAGQPVFTKVADSFLDFVGDAPLVIHNAEFDLDFINAELARAGRDPLPRGRATDTVELARRKFPGSPASLEALCRRFAIDLTARTKHGALIDAELLAKVYLELIGGTQPRLGLVSDVSQAVGPLGAGERPPRVDAPSAEERAAHAAFIATLDNPIWHH